MQVQSEGKLEWVGVVASGSPLALALLDLGEGLTDGAVMVACQEGEHAARRVGAARSTGGERAEASGRRAARRLVAAAVGRRTM